jgi:aspartyl-tRNA synthetase
VAFGGGGKKEFVNYAVKIPCESVVDVFGEVVKPKDPVESVSQSRIEIQASRIYCVSASLPVLPFQLEDAARPDADLSARLVERYDIKDKKDGKKDENSLAITVGVDLRLDNRWIDLRTPANHAIFRLQSRVCQFYRAFFVDRGFIEIHTPKITPGVSEGGADVFKLDYFGKKACLAQSPQLYKQMAVTSDLFKVFEIGHVFRAENSNTHRHMNEFIGLDFEMEVKEHYHEILDVLGGLFVYIFNKLNEHCKAELAAVGKQYPFEPLVYRQETLIFHFTEAIKMLREAGEELGDMDDLTTPQEKKLGKLVKAKYNTDFYIVDKYPITVRPFYTMPCPENPKYTNSYDVFLRGEEITSGAQRIHELALLQKRAGECNIPFNNIAKYLESFQYGAYPHGGAGIGLERVVMLFLGLDNIRKTCMFPRTPNRLEP